MNISIFIQNADDCEADLFSVFYNREYLLCINNGTPFSKRNMSAILNVGDSDKNSEDIRTFGIGFKKYERSAIPITIGTSDY